MDQQIPFSEAASQIVIIPSDSVQTRNIKDHTQGDIIN